MSTVFYWILVIATVLGGIAALVYFRDKWRSQQQWVEEKKEVNSAWWESSELKKQYVANGFKSFGWSNSDRVAERIAEGKAIVYEVDIDNRVKYKLVNSSGQVLMSLTVYRPIDTDIDFVSID